MYLDRLLLQYRRDPTMSKRHQAVMEFMRLNVLFEENRRFIFDAKQANIFSQCVNEFPDEMYSHLRWPFPHIYLEFTSPIICPEAEPGDEIYALCFHERLRKVFEGFNVFDLSKDEAITADGEHITFFGYNRNDLRYFDFSLTLNVQKGEVNSTNVVDTVEEFHDIFGNSQEAAMKTGEITATMPLLGSQIHWAPGFMGYLFSYIMAKGVEIVEQPVPRQQRRAAEREGKIPIPWHIVTVKPTIYTGQRPNEEPTYHHRFRYDVIGHLRFKKYAKLDGTTGYRSEWVRSHQRGLQHELYIPKTYKVKGGRAALIDLREVRPM